MTTQQEGQTQASVQEVGEKVGEAKIESKAETRYFRRTPHKRKEYRHLMGPSARQTTPREASLQSGKSRWAIQNRAVKYIYIYIYI